MAHSHENTDRPFDDDGQVVITLSGWPHVWHDDEGNPVEASNGRRTPLSAAEDNAPVDVPTRASRDVAKVALPSGVVVSEQHTNPEVLTVDEIVALLSAKDVEPSMVQATVQLEHAMTMEAVRKIQSAKRLAAVEEDVMDGFVDFDTFIEGTENLIPVWGCPESPAWASGEPLEVVGGTGVGKSSIVQQVILHGIGVRKSKFLGMTVRPFEKPVLYLALDRANQISRSMKRFSDEVKAAGKGHMVKVFRKRMPDNVLNDPGIVLRIVKMAEKKFGVEFGYVVIDSMKDITPKLSGDDAGGAINESLQLLVADGYEVAVLHHHRKGGESGIDSSFGSTLITAGMGSVLAMNSNPGSPKVTITHEKQPAAPINGGKKIIALHDHATCTTRLMAPGELKGGGSAAFQVDLSEHASTISALHMFWDEREQLGDCSRQDTQTSLHDLTIGRGLAGNAALKKAAAKAWKEAVTGSEGGAA